MTGGVGGPPPTFLTPQRADMGGMTTKQLALRLQCKVMVVFGLGHLVHIPPPNIKMRFGGSGGSGGPPGGVFFAHFLSFLQKRHYRFMKEVENEYSVVKDS